MYDLLNKYIPNDHSRQVTPGYFAENLFMQNKNMQNVMDLGCGAGNSLDYFQCKNPNVN